MWLGQPSFPHLVFCATVAFLRKHDHCSSDPKRRTIKKRYQPQSLAAVGAGKDHSVLHSLDVVALHISSTASSYISNSTSNEAPSAANLKPSVREMAAPRTRYCRSPGHRAATFSEEHESGRARSQGVTTSLYGARSRSSDSFLSLEARN